MTYQWHVSLILEVLKRRGETRRKHPQRPAVPLRSSYMKLAGVTQSIAEARVGATQNKSLGLIFIFFCVKGISNVSSQQREVLTAINSKTVLKQRFLVTFLYIIF